MTTPRESLRVLLIDDDEVDRARVRRMLRPEHEVCEAATAAEGRACAEDGIDGHPADVVLLDLRLPDADGSDLLPWFEARGLPVVMLTGVEDTAVVVEAMHRGALGYLVKGDLDATALEQALQWAVETAALRRAVAEHQAEILEQRDRLAAQAAALEHTNRTIREQEVRVRELAQALTLAEQEERQRIAHVLHDDLQQTLAGALILASAGATDRLEAALGRAVRTARTLSHELAPPLLRGGDLAELLAWMATWSRELYGLDVEVATEGVVIVDQEHVRILLYRVLREILFNVAKHAGTGEARITAYGADGDSMVRIAVEDDGAGFEAAGVVSGTGLASVRERLELVGGRLSITTAPGDGTRVTVEIPAGPRDEATRLERVTNRTLRPLSLRGARTVPLAKRTASRSGSAATGRGPGF